MSLAAGFVVGLVIACLAWVGAELWQEHRETAAFVAQLEAQRIRHEREMQGWLEQALVEYARYRR